MDHFKKIFETEKIFLNFIKHLKYFLKIIHPARREDQPLVPNISKNPSKLRILYECCNTPK